MRVYKRTPKLSLDNLGVRTCYTSTALLLFNPSAVLLFKPFYCGHA